MIEHINNVLLNLGYEDYTITCLGQEHYRISILGKCHIQDIKDNFNVSKWEYQNGKPTFYLIMEK